jgi:intraflagellar transport protein 88
VLCPLPQERKVHRLINQSALAVAKNDLTSSLDIAKDAAKKERALCKFRESKGLTEQINLDLTYSVGFNLACCQYKAKMYSEALSTYGVIVKNKQYPQAGRLRVNMGNIYYEQKKFMNAIKHYRMALDQIPNTSKELRYKIMRNIGHAFVKLGQFHDAIDQYEMVVNEGHAETSGYPDYTSAFNVLVCYYAVGQSDKMRKGFSRLLSGPQPKSYDVTEEEDGSMNEGQKNVLEWWWTKNE